jgi:hypothetical protein
MAECLRDEGWDVTPHEGSPEYLPARSPIPADQQIGFLKAERSCATHTGFGDQSPPPDRAKLEDLYEGVLATESCIEAEGSLVVEMPSREEFVEVRGEWDPYKSLLSPKLERVGAGEYLRLARLCPNPLQS